MTDYYAQVFGVFPNGRVWSTGRHITSSQTEPALLTTWQNAWTAAWTDGTHGLDAMYPVGTKITEFTVSTLNGDFTERSKSGAGVNLLGINTGTSLPSQVSMVISWRSTRVGRHYRGHQSLAAPAEDQVVNDMLTGPAVTRLKAAILAIQAAIQADGSTFFGFNRIALKNGTPAGDKVVYTTPMVRDKIGTQDNRFAGEFATYT